MPSTLLGYPLASGGQQVILGNPWSGTVRPVGGIQLVYAANASGNAYIGFSGGLTITSGGVNPNTSGMNDGMPLSPGQSMFVPKCNLGISGQYSIYAQCDPAASGQARLSFDAF